MIRDAVIGTVSSHQRGIGMYHLLGLRDSSALVNTEYFRVGLHLVPI